MASNWKYSIVEAGQKLQPSQGNLDNEDKFVCNVICTSCTTCFQKDDPESFTCCGLIQNDAEGCKYPFQVLNWVAVIGHFASFIAMSIIYANVNEPFNIPYTETYIQWERLNTTVVIPEQPPPPTFFQSLGGTGMPYVQNSKNFNRCIKNISKTDCKDVKYLQKFQNDDYWVVKADSAITTMPHGCLHVNYDLMDVNEAGMKYREVQWNENTDSVKCSTTGSQGNIGTWNEQIIYSEGDIVKWSIDGGEFTWQFVCNLGQTCIQGLPGEDNSWYRLEGSKMKIQNLNHGNCLCTTNYINGADVFDNFHEVQEGVTDERVTFEVCRSYALLKDVPWLKQFPTKDPFLPETSYSLPHGCLFHYDPSGSDGGTEYRYNTNPSYPHDCSKMSGGSKWYCVVYDPDRTTDANNKRRLTEEVVLANGCPKGKGRINTTDPDEGDFCIGVTTENIPDSGVNLGILIIFFHVLSFLFQGIAGLSAFYPSGIYGFQYTVEIQGGRNLLRFIEYGFSASIMLIAIALLNGVTDVNLIACIAVLTAATQLCGLVCEYLLALRIDDPQKKQNMFYVALIMHLTAWLQFLCAYGVIMHGFLRSATQDEDIQPPSFVYVIVWAIFAFYAVFGAVQVTEILCLKTNLCNCNVAQLRVENQGRINYQCKEMTYVILSLASKLVLGWLIFTNFIFRSN